MKPKVSITIEAGCKVTTIHVGKRSFASSAIKDSETICEIINLAQKLTPYERGRLSDILDLIGE